jgi:hypothetical protein
MNNNICPHCGEKHPTGIRFCPKTGLPIIVITNCPNCGLQVDSDWVICAYCGCTLNNHNKKTPQFQPLQLILILSLIAIITLGGYWLLSGKTTSTTPDPNQVQTQEKHPTSTTSLPTKARILLPSAEEGLITYVANINSIWQVFTIHPDGTNEKQLTNFSYPGTGDPAISPDGTTIAFVNDAKNIYTVKADGSDLKVVFRDKVEAGWPSWSPDSKKIVFASRRNGNLDLFTMNPDGIELVQITDDPAADQDPVFSPDGTQIAFSSNRTGSWEIYILTLASGKIEQVSQLDDQNGTGWPAWSPDGLFIAFESIGEANNRDIYTIRSDGTQLRNITNDPAYDGAPVWSPDGKQIAFVSDRNNALNLYIMQNDGTRLRRLTELWAWGPSWSMTALPETNSLMVALPSETIAAEIEIPPSGKPTPTAKVLSSISAEENPCYADMWRVIPTDVIQYPIGNGWKFVIIEMAIENSSPLWGKLNISDMTLTTEDQFVYKPFSSGYLQLPDTPQTRYSGSHFLSNLGSNNLFIYSLIPPGFVARGDNRGYSMGTRILNYVFEVAESQQNFTLHSKNTSISCILNNGEKIFQSTNEFNLNVTQNITSVSYPLNRKDLTLKEIDDGTIELPGLGTLQFVKIERAQDYWNHEEVVFLHYIFTNGSQGYNTNGEVSGHIIGDDGIVRYPGCPSGTCYVTEGVSAGGYFSAGPGQSTEGVLGILVPSEVKNLKFVLESGNALTVFNLPNDL